MIYAAFLVPRLTKDGREHSQQLTLRLWGGWSCWKTHVETRAGSHGVCVTTQPSTEHSKGSGMLPAHPPVRPCGVVAAHVELCDPVLGGHRGSHPVPKNLLRGDGQHSRRARTLILR